MKIRKPSRRQAIAIEIALNRPHSALHDCWIADDGNLYIAGRGNAVTKPRATTWHEAEVLLREIRAGQITA